MIRDFADLAGHDQAQEVFAVLGVAVGQLSDDTLRFAYLHAPRLLLGFRFLSLLFAEMIRRDVLDDGEGVRERDADAAAGVLSLE